MDRFCKIMTGVVILIMVLTSSLGYFRSNGSIQAPIVIGALFIVLILFCYVYAPKGYDITKGEIIVRRILGKVKIKTSDVENVSIIDPEKMKFTIRTFGVGGVFGYFGKFYNSFLKSFTMYGTQRKNYVLLTMKSGKKIVLTPDDLGMIDSLKITQLNKLKGPKIHQL